MNHHITALAVPRTRMSLTTTFRRKSPSVAISPLLLRARSRFALSALISNLSLSANCSFAFGDSSTEKLSRAFTVGLDAIAASGSTTCEAHAPRKPSNVGITSVRNSFIWFSLAIERCISWFGPLLRDGHVVKEDVHVGKGAGSSTVWRERPRAQCLEGRRGGQAVRNGIRHELLRNGVVDGGPHETHNETMIGPVPRELNHRSLADVDFA